MCDSYVYSNLYFILYCIYVHLIIILLLNIYLSHVFESKPDIIATGTVESHYKIRKKRCTGNTKLFGFSYSVLFLLLFCFCRLCIFTLRENVGSELLFLTKMSTQKNFFTLLCSHLCSIQSQFMTYASLHILLVIIFIYTQDNICIYNRNLRNHLREEKNNSFN